jgi:hypothetical protein
MSVKLEFCNVIVRVEQIKAILGERFFEDKFKTCTEITWQDGYLYREGCMNPWDLADLLDDWEQMGFELSDRKDGEKIWKDVCVVNSGTGPTHPCSWIEFDPGRNIVWLKGNDPGAPVGPQGRKVAGEA